MSLVAIVVEGVLRQEHGHRVISQGELLYHALTATTRVALLTNTDDEEVYHWLKVNGFRDHLYVITPASCKGDDISDIRMRQIARLQRDGTPLAFLVEADPHVAARVMMEGYPVLTVLHPKYSRPSFRPDYQARVTPWSELTAEVDKQRELRAEDGRMDEET